MNNPKTKILIGLLIVCAILLIIFTSIDIDKIAKTIILICILVFSFLNIFTVDARPTSDKEDELQREMRSYDHQTWSRLHGLDHGDIYA
jgi:amino acid permease